MSSVLTVPNVSCAASNGTVLLEDASFELEEGAILVIAGPNGAGKTTLLNVLCGINSPTSGAVLIGERPLSAMPAAERARQFAVVGQQDMPDGRLTLREYVTLGQIPIQSERSATDHAEALARTLDVTGLTTLADKKMAVLSGGESTTVLSDADAGNGRVITYLNAGNNTDIDLINSEITHLHAYGTGTHDIVLGSAYTRSIWLEGSSMDVQIDRADN